MDLLKAPVKQIYKRYLIPTLGSALAMSIYSFVDTMAVGRYAGAAGTGALAVVNIVYVLMVVIAYLCATGGSVRYGNAAGKGKIEKGNGYFTVSAMLCLILTGICWIIFLRLHTMIFQFFGADAEVLVYAEEYGIWIIRFFPVIVLPDFLASFLRMDHAPNRALGAVIAGGCLNMFLDWLLVFPIGLGVKGAAIATVIGTSLQCLIMMGHFFSGKCHLKLVKPAHPFQTAVEILSTGLSASVLDAGNVILAIVMNNQLCHYGGTAALGVYGVINTLSLLFQALFAGIGQTIQPGVSVNYGAEQIRRVREFSKYAGWTAFGMGSLFTLLMEAYPLPVLHIFMKASAQADQIGPLFMRIYALSYPFLGCSVSASYFLQSILAKKEAGIIAMLRSMILPVLFLGIFPLWFGKTGIYIAVPVSEIIVFLITGLVIHRKVYALT